MRRLKIPLALAAILLAFGWLLASGVARNDAYMSTLAQWEPERARRETVRLMGFVKAGSIEQEPDSLVTRFVIRDETGSLEQPARFTGVTPGLFRGDSAVVAAGRLGDDGVFAATDLMTKCPSKYEGMDTPHDGTPLSGAPSGGDSSAAADAALPVGG